MSKKITSRLENFSKWYNDIILQADLAENSGVRGCMVIKPYGFAVWEEMKNTLPQQFFMEGVCEQNIVGLSAGLAMEGFVPYINTIGTFLTRRCYEQILLDVCLHNLPVRFLGNGGGGVYASLGPTHLSLEDFSILRSIPNMTVLAPCDKVEMKNLIIAMMKDGLALLIEHLEEN